MERLSRLHRKTIEAERLAAEERQLHIEERRLKQDALEQEKLLRKQQVQERLSRMEKEREEKHEKWRNEKKIQADLNKKQPLFKKIEEDYAKQSLLEDQLKQKTIEEKKIKFKPIIQEELDHFSNKVEQIVQYLTRKRQEYRAEQTRVDLDFSKLRSQTYELIVDQDKELREQNQVQKKEKKQMLKRRQNYSKYVKRVHLPPKSEKKAYEMQYMISQLKHPVKNQIKYSPGIQLESNYNNMTKRTSYSLDRLGQPNKGYQRNPKAYQTDASNLKLPPIASTNQMPESQNGSQSNIENMPESQMDLKHLFKSNSYKHLRSDYINQQKGSKSRSSHWQAPAMGKHSGAISNSNPALRHLDQVDVDSRRIRFADANGRSRPSLPSRDASSKDYLAEIREKRLKQANNQNVTSRVKNVLKNQKLSNLEKLQMVRDQAEEIEKMALKRERTQLVEDVQGNQKNQIQQEFEKVDQVNSMLLDAIKAKLAILDQQQS